MFRYDWLAQEWAMTCGACGATLYAPTRSEILISFKIHTHGAECLGGY